MYVHVFHWDFAFQNGSRMASMLNLGCLACCIRMVRQFCFPVAEKVLGSSVSLRHCSVKLITECEGGDKPPRNRLVCSHSHSSLLSCSSCWYLDSEIPCECFWLRHFTHVCVWQMVLPFQGVIQIQIHWGKRCFSRSWDFPVRRAKKVSRVLKGFVWGVVGKYIFWISDIGEVFFLFCLYFLFL